VTSPRLLAAGGGVTLLLVVAGIASHGRPLAGGLGRGPSARFFDYVTTTLVVLALAMLVLIVYALFSERGGRPRAQRSSWQLLSILLTFALSAAFAAFLLHSRFAQRLHDAAGKLTNGQHGVNTGDPTRAGKDTRNPQFRWDEIWVLVVLLGGTAVVLYAQRRTRPLPRPWGARRAEVVSIALDESLDDLRTDPDLRRAIVAAYARMEHALAGVGLPRDPAEAPFEYVARALESLDASAAAAERLTALFEWAKFSQHEPGPEMRDEAVDALVAVRDELRRPAAEAVPA
jgi:hypothetical protein